jgi:hypothetical protein
MITTLSRNKRSGARIVTMHVVRHCVEVVYIKVITKRLTTREATEEGVSKACQLALLVAQQIASGNLNVHS